MYKRIISRLDIKNGILVKGIQLEGLRNLGNPSYFAQKYYEDGIDEISFQDVVATLYNKDLISRIVEECSKNIFVNVAVGGGLKKIENVDNLLRIGVDKVCINSEGIRNNEFLKKLVKIYGSSTIAVNIDVIYNGNYYEVLIETGREKTNIRLESWIEKLNNLNTDIKTFFEEVMINANEEDIRINRLALLTTINNYYKGVADITILSH